MTTTSDRMSDPTEVLRNLRELLDCATHRCDETEKAYLSNIIDQIENHHGREIQ